MHEKQNELVLMVRDQAAVLMPGQPAHVVALTVQSAIEVAVGPDGLFQQKRSRPVTSAVSSIKLIPEWASASTQMLHKFHDQGFQHGGINE